MKQLFELFTAQGDAVDWLEETDGEETLVIMPRLITEVLEEKLFSEKITNYFLICYIIGQ